AGTLVAELTQALQSHIQSSAAAADGPDASLPAAQKLLTALGKWAQLQLLGGGADPRAGAELSRAQSGGNQPPASVAGAVGGSEPQTAASRPAVPAGAQAAPATGSAAAAAQPQPSVAAAIDQAAAQ